MTTAKIREIIKEIRERAERAKLGPLIIQRFDNDGGDIHYQIETEDVTREDMIFASVWNHKARAEFVQHSATDIPALLSALETALDALEKISTGEAVVDPNKDWLVLFDEDNWK